MRAAIDAAGRIVVPKPLRQALGLKPGQALEIHAGDGQLEIEIAHTPMRLKRRGKGVVAVPDIRLPVLTADQVRDTLIATLWLKRRQVVSAKPFRPPAGRRLR